MSVYILGKVDVGSSAEESIISQLTSIVDLSSAYISFDSVDDEDREVMDHLGFEGGNCYFSIFSSQLDTDAVVLWNEAREIAYKSLSDMEIAVPARYEDLKRISWPARYYDINSHSRLGHILSGLETIGGYNQMGIAIIDGGIESTVRCTIEACVRHIQRTFVLAWDVLPNSMFVWKR